MGKLLWTILAAAAGFVAAVAATPDDEVHRAYERGYAEGAKSLQTDAVRRGYGAWEPADAAGQPGSFRWAGQISHGHRKSAEQKASDNSPRAANRRGSETSDEGIGG
jgi:hypothetical protein